MTAARRTLDDTDARLLRIAGLDPVSDDAKRLRSMYTVSVEFNEAFDRALGHGPEGPTYVAPRARRPSPFERARAWAWYRWGWGSRPKPRLERVQTGVAEGRRGRGGRHGDETHHAGRPNLLDIFNGDVA